MNDLRSSEMAICIDLHIDWMNSNDVLSSENLIDLITMITIVGLMDRIGTEYTKWAGGTV